MTRDRRDALSYVISGNQRELAVENLCGFPAAALDFILNYDTRLHFATARQVKYRLGRDPESEVEGPVALNFGLTLRHSWAIFLP